MKLILMCGLIPAPHHKTDPRRFIDRNTGMALSLSLSLGLCHRLALRVD